MLFRSLAGKEILNAKEIYSKLQKFDASKVRSVPKEVKALKKEYKNSELYHELVRTHQGEVDFLKRVAGNPNNAFGLTEADLTTIAKGSSRGLETFGYSSAFSHRVPKSFNINSYQRNAPSNIFEEHSFMNKFFEIGRAHV